MPTATEFTSRLAPPARRRTASPVVILATLVVGGILLLVASHLFRAHRHLAMAGSSLRASRHALADRDETTATAMLDRADRRLKAAAGASAAFPLRFIGAVPLVGSPARASISAARAGREGVAAGRTLVTAMASFPTSASAGVNGHDLSAFHAAAVRSATAIAHADDRLARADEMLAGPAGAALPVVAGPARAMRADLDRARGQLDGAWRAIALLEGLTSTKTEVRLLLLAQDSLELRPTGGYIGSYGVLRFSKGTVRLERYEATEDLPAPVPSLRPPEGLSQYLPSHWGLSNANWWPDFPTSAAAAAEMFRRQAGGEVDGVLALTEHATARLVGAVGPLHLPGYASPVTEEGFDRRVVFEVEQKRPPDVPRKKFLIELAEVLFDRLFHLPAEQLPAVAGAVRNSVAGGDLQLWFRDGARRRLLSGTAVAGALPRTEDDFLMVVDANMAASKANLDVVKQLDYEIERRDGRLEARLRVEIHNRGVRSPTNPHYNGYLRVYAPAGSHLLRSDGLQSEQAAFDGPFQVFIQPIVVEPQDKGVATFSYSLPERIGAGGTYRLSWLRQVGTPDDILRLVVDGRRADVGPGARSLHFERQLDGDGALSWLRRRWLVQELGM